MKATNYKITAFRLSLRFPLGEVPVTIISEGLGA